jgi:hypothetical protein
MGQPEEFTAGAIDINNGRTGQIQIIVDRWSTPAERAKLIVALLEKGPDGLLKALQDTRPVGRIRTPDSIGYDLHYAAQRPDGTGEGKLALAARVAGDEDTKMIEVENYDMQPVRLVEVKATPRKR